MILYEIETSEKYIASHPEQSEGSQPPMYSQLSGAANSVQAIIQKSQIPNPNTQIPNK
jgi:hypothetical protein